MSVSIRGVAKEADVSLDVDCPHRVIVVPLGPHWQMPWQYLAADVNCFLHILSNSLFTAVS
jgi:hypothetical protein